MPQSKTKPKDVTVKIDGRLYKAVKDHKEDTGVTVYAFVNKAIEEKLAKDAKSKK